MLGRWAGRTDEVRLANFHAPRIANTTMQPDANHKNGANMLRIGAYKGMRIPAIENLLVGVGRDPLVLPV
jgi:hypothetical protein